MQENPGYYAIIPAEIRYDPTLSSTAKLLYGEITSLCSKYNECWATNEYFASLYHCSNRTISRLIGQLNSKGYVKIEMIYSVNTKNIDKRIISLSNTYGKKCREGIENNVNTPMEKNVQENNTRNTNNTSINIPPIVPQKSHRKIADNLWEKQFNAFWEIYPKKIKKSMAKSWFEKNKPDEKVYQQILEKLKLFCKTKTWKKENGQFIPHAITWLNQKRWEDEIDDSEIEKTKQEENEQILAEIEAEKCR